MSECIEVYSNGIMAWESLVKRIGFFVGEDLDEQQISDLRKGVVEELKKLSEGPERVREKNIDELKADGQYDCRASRVIQRIYESSMFVDYRDFCNAAHNILGCHRKNTGQHPERILPGLPKLEGIVNEVVPKYGFLRGVESILRCGTFALGSAGFFGGAILTGSLVDNVIQNPYLLYASSALGAIAGVVVGGFTGVLTTERLASLVNSFISDRQKTLEEVAHKKFVEEVENYIKTDS